MRRTPTVQMWLGRRPRCQRRLQTDTLWRVSVIECLEPRPLATNLRRHLFAYNATPIGTQRLSRTRSAPGRDGMLRTGKLLTLCRRFEGSLQVSNLSAATHLGERPESALKRHPTRSRGSSTRHVTSLWPALPFRHLLVMRSRRRCKHTDAKMSPAASVENAGGASFLQELLG
jgi:hypothetical protein